MSIKKIHIQQEGKNMIEWLHEQDNSICDNLIPLLSDNSKGKVAFVEGTFLTFKPSSQNPQNASERTSFKDVPLVKFLPVFAEIRKNNTEFKSDNLSEELRIYVQLSDGEIVVCFDSHYIYAIKKSDSI